MPVKWDSEKDKFILNVLLTDPSVNIGAAAIENIIKSWRKSPTLVDPFAPQCPCSYLSWCSQLIT